MTRKRNKKYRPSVAPQPTERLMDDVFRWLKLDEPARAYRALRAWQRAAGPRIVARARAERLRGSILFVRVTASSWAQELNILKEQLIAKLQRTPGGEVVRDIRFNVGPLDDLPDWDALAAPPPSAPSSTHPDVLPEALAEAVANVKDPELRDELSRLLLRESAPK
jgi:hypothetical protein